MTLTLITPPATALLTLTEVKEHLRVDTSGSDDELTRLITAATSYLDARDGVLGRCLVSQVWRYDISGFSPAIRVPLPPTISVDSIQYYDTTDTLQTLASDQYRVLDGGFTGSVIITEESVTYPATNTRPDAVRITFTAGYTTVPENIKIAAVMMIKTWYDNPGADIPEIVSTLIAPYRLTYVA